MSGEGPICSTVDADHRAGRRRRDRDLARALSDDAGSRPIPQPADHRSQARWHLRPVDRDAVRARQRARGWSSKRRAWANSVVAAAAGFDDECPAMISAIAIVAVATGRHTDHRAALAEEPRRGWAIALRGVRIRDVLLRAVRHRTSPRARADRRTGYVCSLYSTGCGSGDTTDGSGSRSNISAVSAETHGLPGIGGGPAGCGGGGVVIADI